MFRGIDLLIFVSFFALTIAGVPLQRYEALMKQKSEDLGLYNASDKVVKITESNFNETILEQNRSALVEFYNTYCGHCKRFAPIYKQLAQQLYPWRDILIVSAIDCAAEENNALCRQYEIMGYPTLRYMGPGFQPTDKNLGQNIETQLINEIRRFLSGFLAAENRTTNNPYWPNLQPLTDNDNIANLFEGLDNQKKFIAIIHAPENSTIGIETAMFLLPWSGVEVRYTHDANIAAKYKINATVSRVAIIARNGDIEQLSPAENNALSYTETIEKRLRAAHLTQRVESLQTTTSSAIEEKHRQELAQNKEVVETVRKNKHFVYQADLELAIRSALFNEVPKIGVIGGERLLALQRFLRVLQRYNPLGANGHALISHLNDYIVQFNQQLSGKDFEDEVKRLEQEFTPIFSSNHFIGCTGSRSGLRGYTCSLWQLFHYLTVQSASNDDTQDPLEVLQAMHGYIKYFFGCTNCAEHFQAMATRRKIWSVPTKDDAVLWLWAAHNEVNQRLAGDATEDPEFPKIQFPSPISCTECFKQPNVLPTNLEANWRKDAVLTFLKHIHHPANVSRYGVVREELLQPSLEKLRQKRQIANVFSDMDMRMGMLLYGFCIVMMVVAFKLFVFKGYRKKPYGHDILGKV